MTKKLNPVHLGGLALFHRLFSRKYRNIKQWDPCSLCTLMSELPRCPLTKIPRGSEDLSGSFERSSHFYERGERTETSASGYIRRGGSSSASGAYHSAESLSRSRARDRLYRNGPYTPLIERDPKQRIGEARKGPPEAEELVRHNRVVSRSGSSGHHRVSSGGWGYDSPSPRYSATGVPSTPELPYADDRRETTPVVHKKHSKSGFSTQNNSYPTLLISISRRSGSDSPSNSGSSGCRSRSSSASSQSGSSTCSSASSSPTSEKSCSTHSQHSSLRSGAQTGVSASHTNSVSPAVHAEDRRPLAICVRNLPARSSDTSLKDGLYHEYKKHGKVTWVKVVGQGVDRYALVCFKKADDVEKALQVSHDKLFFGCKIEVAPYQGYDVDDNEFRPFEAEQDEFHPKATRTLFIGNLEKDITTQEIRKHFDQFGEIIEIDIKKQGNSASYAFCQFSDISSVVRAMRTLDGEHIGANRIKLGFGKSMHTNCVWVDGVSETVSEKYLSTHFGQFGPVTHVVIDRSRGHALVFYEQIPYAQQAVKDMRGNSLRGRKLQVDYASRECQEAFYDRIDKQTSTSHTNFDSSVQASPQGTSTIVRVYDNSSTVSSPVVNSAPTRYPTLTTGGSGVVVTTRFNTTAPTATSRASFNRPSATSPTTPLPSPRSSRHGHSASSSSSSQRCYEDNQSCDDGGTPTTPMAGSGEIRHLQKERVSLIEQLEDCTSSGEDTVTGRRRCSKHRRSQSGGEGSRPGTPLCDERPDPPVEPRRVPRDRPPDPLSLPLPRFAAQVLSPRPVPPSPPASPQTPHSSSSDSEPSPPSPEWEERLRSLDEKYEKWSGSRSGVTKVDPSTMKVKHKLLELDLHELQPSEIVKSVLAKRSVFDEDSKRLENFGEKYEPREFVPASRANVLRRLDMSPLSSPVNKSPGLQYPFPSHPPALPQSSGGLSSSSNVPTLTVASESKPSNSFLSNCTRQFTPKIPSPPSTSSSIETSPRPSTQQSQDKFKAKCNPTSIPPPPNSSKKDSMSTPPPKPKPCSIQRDSTEEKSELRRKSRDEVCTESVAKKDDISESDKVKDAQISERRKSSVDKRRGSVDVKDFSNSKPLENSCDRPKETSDKQEEKRRGSSDADNAPAVNDPRLRVDAKKPHDLHDNQIYDNTRQGESEQRKRTLSDCMERKKEVESLHRHNSTESQDKKKDVLGVHSEKDRRRARESVDSLSDTPKNHRKVPEIMRKEIDSVSERHEKDEDTIRFVDAGDKKKDSSNDHQQMSSKFKDKRDSVDKRRDSRDEQGDKSKNDKMNCDDLERLKDHKRNDSIDSTKKREHHDSDKTSRKEDDPSKNNKQVDYDIAEVKKEPKHKEERRKNSETEISKEHSIFKKVFGFADSIRHHKGGVDKRDNDTSTAVKTDTPEPVNKYREKKEKKEKEDHSESKHKPRRSPDSTENNKHGKDDKRRHSESKRKDSESCDDVKPKEENHLQDLKLHNKSDRKKEDPSYKDSNHRNAYYENNSSEHSKYNRDSERRKDPLQDEPKKSESDTNCLEKIKKDELVDEEFYERRKDDIFRSKEEYRRKGSFDANFDNIYETAAFSKANFKDNERKNDVIDPTKYKHDRHREKSKDHDVQNCRTKDERKNETHDKHKTERRKESDGHRVKEEKKTSEEIFDSLKNRDNNERRKDDYDGVKPKEDSYTAYRDSIRKKDAAEAQERLKEITERKKEEKERRKEREQLLLKETTDERKREKDNDKLNKSKPSRDYNATEPKLNGDHDSDYSLDTTECRKIMVYEEADQRDMLKKDKKRDKNAVWPATIGCKRRLSSQDSIDTNEDKRNKPERRDSKDSGRSSGSSRKGSGEKQIKGYKMLEEKIKEDKEKEQKKNAEENNEVHVQFEEKPPKPAVRKEKRNSGEKRKEEGKFKSRPRENGTASESDMASGDDDPTSKANKNRQQHSIFDIVDDEPAYISMYDKVKARSTKNMQKLEEEKRQEKLKEKFHALKQSRAKREEKKRSTSYDEDSDSEKSSARRSKLLLTSSEDDANSESDVKLRKNKVRYDTSEDDAATPNSTRGKKSSFREEVKSVRKIVSDISEDETPTPAIASIKHSTPKMKMNRNITFDMEPKSRKIMSDTSEDDSSRINSTPRNMKPSRIHSDDSEGDLGFEDSIRNEIKPLPNITDMFQSRPVEVNHFTNSVHEEPVQHPLQSSPESFRRNSLDSTASEQHRKKSHKKKQKRQKNLEETEDGIIKKHISKKEKKRAHRDKDDEEKRKKRAERENNKRDDKLEDIFGPLSDDSVKALGNKWNVAQVYGSDSESERENIRKKEKKRREKKMRELDEAAGRAIEAKLMDTCDNISLEEPVKTKKKKRKKSRDEKNKHHQSRAQDDEPPMLVHPKEESKDSLVDDKTMPVIDIKEEAPDDLEVMRGDVKAENDGTGIKQETKMECDDSADGPPDLRQQSMSSLLDSPPPLHPNNIASKKPGIPGFSSEIDENIHETAVKSISESTCTTLDESDLKYDDKSKNEDISVPGEEGKPTPVISQEETEDAVAALLMEDTFGGGFDGYNEDTPKPDTPVSEPDLQIDTDTEDTYDPIDFSRPPRTPDIPSNLYRQADTREGLEERIMMSLACSSDSSLKESPRPLRMPPTPDHKPDKKDASDSDSFEPEKLCNHEKPSVVKQLTELDDDDDASREATAAKETHDNYTAKDEETLDETQPKDVLNKDLALPAKVPEKDNLPERHPSPKTTTIPPLEIPKLIVIPQKPPSAIATTTVPPNVPTLVPLSGKSESLANFQNFEQVHHNQIQISAKSPNLPIPQQSTVIGTAELAKEQNATQHSSPLSTSPKTFSSLLPLFSGDVSPKSQHRVKVSNPEVTSNSMPFLTTTTTTTPSSQFRTQHVVSPPSSTPAQATLTTSVHPLQTQSATSQPPPLVHASLAKPPSLLPTSHGPMPPLTSSLLVNTRVDVITSTKNSTSPLSPVSASIGQRPNFAAKVGHRLPINPLPPLKPMVNFHSLQPSTNALAKSNTTVTLSTPNQIAAPVRTIHPLASLTLLPTVKENKPPTVSSPSATHTKQLHIITQVSQLSPTSPMSPQNVKLVRPAIVTASHIQIPPLQNINIQPLKTPVITQHSPNRTNSPTVPLLQTVNIDDHIKSSPQFAGKPLIPVPSNAQLLPSPIDTTLHPEKVLTLSPSQPPALQSTVVQSVQPLQKPSTPFEVIKSSDISPKDAVPSQNDIDTKLPVPTPVETPSSLASNLSSPKPTSGITGSAAAVVSPTPDKVEDRASTPSIAVKDYPNPNESDGTASKSLTDESKPLNAVIQDLTLRAASKQQQQTCKPNAVETQKSESTKPIEQVIKELAMRKKQVSDSKELGPTENSVVEDPKREPNDPKVGDFSADLPNLVPVGNSDDSPEVKNIDTDIKSHQDIGSDVEPIENATPQASESEEKIPLTDHSADQIESFPKESSPAPVKKLPNSEEAKLDPGVDEPPAAKISKGMPKERQSAEREVLPKADSIPMPSRGGRGGRKRKGAGGRGGISTRRTRATNAPNTTPSTDIYEFRDDSEEETGRPRLILTIKSPPEPPVSTKIHSTPAPQVVQPPSPPSSAALGATTRKSRRLQKDGPKAEDVAEDVVNARGRPTRRATRRTVPNITPPVETTRKSPRRKQQLQSAPPATSTSSTLQVPAHNTRQRSASPVPSPSEPSARRNKSPTPVRQPSPAKAPVPLMAASSPAPPTPPHQPSSEDIMPATPTPIEPTVQSQPTSPLVAAAPVPVVTSVPTLTSSPVMTESSVVTSSTVVAQSPVVTQSAAITQSPVVMTVPVVTSASVVTSLPVVTSVPSSVGQPTPPPTPSTPSSQTAPTSSAPVTITSSHSISTVPAPVHSVSVPVVAVHPQVAPAQIKATNIMSSHLPSAGQPMQPQPTHGQQPPFILSHNQQLQMTQSHGHQPPLTPSHGQPAQLQPTLGRSPPLPPTPGKPMPIQPSPGQHAPVQPTPGQLPPIQPTPAQPPPAHSGITHSLPVSSMHPVAAHLPPTAHSGLLIPMTESEEGQYIPIGDPHRNAGGNVTAHLGKEPSEGEPPEKRARLLNLAGKDEALARSPLSRPSVVRPTASQPSPTSSPTATPPAAHSQSVKVMVPTSHPMEAHLGRGPHIPPQLIGSGPPKVPMSGIVPMPPKTHILQAVRPYRVRPQAPPSPAQHPKGPMAPRAHMHHQSMGNAQAREGVAGSPAPPQGSLLTGSVASPPLRAHQQPVVTGASSGRALVKTGDSQNSRVMDGKHIVVPQQSQAPPPRSQVVQPGLPLSAYEPSMHSVVAELLPNPPWPQRQSPPPAHQNSTQPQGEVVQHVSSYPAHHHYVPPPFVFQPPYLREAAGMPTSYHRSAAPKAASVVKGTEIDERSTIPSPSSASAMVSSPPLELRRGSPHDRTQVPQDSSQVVPVYMHRSASSQQFYYESPHHAPPPAHRPHNPPAANAGRLQTPPHASQVPHQADSLLMLLQRYPVMWQGLLALKNDQAAVQMHFVWGNPVVARESLPCNSDGSTPPLRIAQRMRLDQTQVEGFARKMQMDNEHCMLLALPCGRDHMDVLQQSNNLQNGFITYLQQKQAAGIVNLAAPGSPQPAYVVHIFPSCDFANESLARIAPDLLHRVADLAHLLIVIATV
ncbi:SPOC domain [Nesidiocoris tenuis]|uniref:SPOC domain n=1 Tax=Nesidiocoris tenuis TaxID=355587 RepID=A0ABN7AMX0_9HEMI|nr:SPOC domain [Nesidiocoris tenuis]